MILYHICEQERWEAAGNEAYIPESLKQEGFIHLSTKEQMFKTWETYYRNKPGLICLVIEIPEHDTHLKFDFVPVRNEKLPHYYQPLSLKYICESRSIPIDDDEARAFFEGL